jgi:hypothetical protein
MDKAIDLVDVQGKLFGVEEISTQHPPSYKNEESKPLNDIF